MTFIRQVTCAPIDHLPRNDTPEATIVFRRDRLSFQPVTHRTVPVIAEPPRTLNISTPILPSSVLDACQMLQGSPLYRPRTVSAWRTVRNEPRTSAVGAAQLSPARKRCVSAAKNGERRRCDTDRPRNTYARARYRSAVATVAIAFLVAPCVSAKTKSQSTDSLDAYLATARKSAPADIPSVGSLWNPNGRMSDLATDTKARFIGDLVTINIIESTNSAQQESAQTSRAFSASSSLAALLGTTNARAQNLFSPSSTQSLNGKGQTALATSLTTTLAASVTEVLPNGNLVIEARRDVLVTNQKETMILRGIIRREDLSPTNVVASTAISHLEVSLKGNGVISETTREPNVIVRILLRVLNF